MRLNIVGIVLALSMFTSAVSANINDVKKAYASKDFHTTMKLARPLADTGDVFAHFLIGTMLVEGQGVSVNTEEGLRHIRIAADGGFAIAQAIMAAAILDGKLPAENFDNAKDWAEKAAAQNVDFGHLMLSIIYMNGLGVPQDTQTGMEHLQKAASNGETVAKLELGKALLLGRGTARDETHGTKLMKAAASESVEFVERVKLVLSRTNQLWELQQGKAKLNCSSFACASSAGWNSKKLRGYMDKYRWAELAAQVLDVGEESDLQYFYLGRSLEGIGNLAVARQYYKIALDPKQRGVACAGIINNCEGSVFPRDINNRLLGIDVAEKYASQQFERQEVDRLALQRSKAEETAKTAETQRLAEQAKTSANLSAKATDGDHQAQYQLAHYFFGGGVGGVVDVPQGMNWLIKAAEGGLAKAQFELGERLLDGMGVTADERRAESWLRKAVAQGHRTAEVSIAQLQRERQMRAMRTEQVRLSKERELAVTAATAVRNAADQQAEATRKRRENNIEKLKAL